MKQINPSYNSSESEDITAEITLALYFLFKVLTCSCTLFIQSRMVVAGFHYSHLNDVKYRRYPSFNSHVIFVGFAFCNLEWVIWISRYVQLLPHCLTGNRSFLNFHNRSQQADEEQITEETSPLEAWSTMSISFAGRREFLFLKKKKKSKEQQTLIFTSLSSLEIIHDMKERETKSSGEKKKSNLKSTT